MKLLIGTEEYLKHWEDIIDTVDKTNFPIRFVNSITFDVNEDSKYTFKKSIDVAILREEGYDDQSIQEIITETLLDFPDDEGEMKFNLDIISISIQAQIETDKILKNLI